ncbi:hypothetical protein K4K49_005986 [Colletotrichum sp. SAR 10_70]|nr:hypothetical protein K4K50_005198 [Colletotrichum sp. SAR 10_71]KAI8157168.1 hypothetical protein KHU50_009626 [Colletotrichum sp. SAR 10_65]KAI8164551.1 hypothetical protein K4K49_005986 [Colletotrichum sp. SAR 10_70]KAI8217435.1 hypothetical protein K4K54_011621 [Colletotrichum sp. SAR 10_86]KAI8245659.1 hypothetical protein K4K53_002761 [Colletotrichum sp. SAR 10_77]KAJ4998534.1 hypothetical protein K4K48_005311 [Colletotrichum sp. SAR 10_66]
MGIATQPSPSAEAQVVDLVPRDATNDEIEKLPHVVDRLPPEAWVAALIGASERFSYYCFVSIWRDQYKQKPPQLVRQKDGLPAVVDGTRTLQFLYNAFYWFTNIASLSSIPATFLEREFGFWTAYLMAAISVMAAVSLLLIFKSRLARNGFNLDHAKQSYQTEAHGTSVPWGDKFVDELRRGLLACRVIFCFAFFYLAITQMFNNLISQAGQMQLHGVPNDMLQAMAGVACVVFGPIIQALYNFLAKRRVSFGPMARIAVAFLICGGGMGYAAGLQKMIYSAGPCFDAPRACAASDGGRLPNDVNVWLQLPVYVALAIAEIFGLVTASEYAYSKAPKNMKSIVQAMVQLSACLGSLMAMTLSPVSRDPHLVIVYAVIAGVMGACSALFWWKFQKYDAVDRELNDLVDEERESGVASTQADTKERT